MNTLVLNGKEEQLLRERKAVKALLWVSLISIFMLFAGLTSAYIVRQAEGNWLEFALPRMFYYSTAIILVSSITINWAMSSAKKDNQKNLRIALLLTLALGLTFVFLQVSGWKELIALGIFFGGDGSTASGSYMYVLSGVHLAHLIGGIISLLIVLFNAFKGKYNPANLFGLQLCSIYWHFLDILWIYLFLFLLFIR